MPTNKTLPRIGETVETVCLVMALLSLAGGVICAVQFGKTIESSYGGSLRVVTSGPMVAGWLAAGAGSAIMWWVLGKIGTALRWLEAIGDKVHASVAPEQATETTSQSDWEIAQEVTAKPQPKPAPQPKSPEQLAKEGEESRRSMLVVGAVLVAVAVAFFFLIGGRLR